ncbi:MAG: putative endonuclease [Candidatus Dependentiae bacterium]|nr:putative endonuclease [Candidatus Dependentiae bacterium]
MHVRQTIGVRGEHLAARYLEALGYTTLTINFSVHRVGEIDLVMQRGDYVVCVEVKTRHNRKVPFEFLIPREKQRKIIMTARHLVQQYDLCDAVVRFDVVFVDLSGTVPAITHIENAFQAVVAIARRTHQ